MTVSLVVNHIAVNRCLGHVCGQQLSRGRDRLGLATARDVQACATCRINPRACSGALSRCIGCLKASVDAERRERATRAARSHPPAAERSKACRICKVIKPLTAFHRHARVQDGHHHDCRDCAKARRRQA